MVVAGLVLIICKKKLVGVSFDDEDEAVFSYKLVSTISWWWSGGHDDGDDE